MNSQICIPLKSLAVKGEGDKDVAPASGDSVDLTATGTVDRIEGDSAYINLATVNGQPVSGPEPDGDETEGMDMRAAGEAADADSGNY